MYIFIILGVLYLYYCYKYQWHILPFKHFPKQTTLFFSSPDSLIPWSLKVWRATWLSSRRLLLLERKSANATNTSACHPSSSKMDGRHTCYRLMDKPTWSQWAANSSCKLESISPRETRQCYSTNPLHGPARTQVQGLLRLSENDQLYIRGCRRSRV